MPDANALEPLDFVVELGKHTSNLAIESLRQDHLEAFSRIELHRLRFCEAFLKMNSIEELLGVLNMKHPVENYFILLLDMIARVGE